MSETENTEYESSFKRYVEEGPRDMPERWEDLPTRDSLSPDEREIIESAGEKFSKTAYFVQGGTPAPGEQFERLYTGHDKSEALGNAYHTRDQIRDNGMPCEAEYVEPHHRHDGRVYHKIKFTIPEQ